MEVGMRGRGAGRYAPKNQTIEVSEKHIGLRLAAAVLFLLFGAGMIAYGASKFFGTESGWQEISASSDEVGCGEEFTLLYNLGASGISASAQSKLVTACYSEAAVNAWQLFDVYSETEGVVNPYALNNSPNTVCEVDPALYAAFERIAESGSRFLYLGPIYAMMENLYGCSVDGEARELDPAYSEEVAEDFAQILAFANDSGAIELQLLGDGKVILYVSEEYLAFAEEDGITRFIDFFPLINAFRIDYLADTLIENGFTDGVLSSDDGYTRNLDGGTEEVGFILYGRIDDTIYPAAWTALSGVDAVITLRDFPLQDSGADEYRYFVYTNGEIRTPYVSSADGVCHGAVSSLVACDDGGSCTALALAMYPAFLEEADFAFPEGVGVIYCDGQEIRCNYDGASFTNLYEGDGVSYSVSVLED